MVNRMDTRSRDEISATILVSSPDPSERRVIRFNSFGFIESKLSQNRLRQPHQQEIKFIPFGFRRRH